MLVAGNRSGRTRMRDLHRSLLSARFKRFWGAMLGRVCTKFLHEVCATWGFCKPAGRNAGETWNLVRRGGGLGNFLS